MAREHSYGRPLIGLGLMCKHEDQSHKKVVVPYFVGSLRRYGSSLLL